MKTKEQLAKEYSNSVIDKIRKDRKEDPSHNIGYGDISEIAYKIGFDVGAKHMQEKCIEILEKITDYYDSMDYDKFRNSQHAGIELTQARYIKYKIQNLMQQESGNE